MGRKLSRENVAQSLEKKREDFSWDFREEDTKVLGARYPSLPCYDDTSDC